jgi:hypothetical protein
LLRNNDLRYSSWFHLFYRFTAIYIAVSRFARYVTHLPSGRAEMGVVWAAVTVFESPAAAAASTLLTVRDIYELS